MSTLELHSALAVLGALPELTLNVLLRPVLAVHLVHVSAGARVRLAPQHVEIRLPHDLLRLGIRHRALLPVLGAAPPRLARVLLRPPVVDDAAAVQTQPLLVGLPAENVLVGAANDH